MRRVRNNLANVFFFFFIFMHTCLHGVQFMIEPRLQRFFFLFFSVQRVYRFRLCGNGVNLVERQRICTEFDMFMQNFYVNQSFTASEKPLRYLIWSVFLFLKTYACVYSVHTNCNLEKSIENIHKKQIYNNERLYDTTVSMVVSARAHSSAHTHLRRCTKSLCAMCVQRKIEFAHTAMGKT